MATVNYGTDTDGSVKTLVAANASNIGVLESLILYVSAPTSITFKSGDNTIFTIDELPPPGLEWRKHFDNDYVFAGVAANEAITVETGGGANMSFYATYSYLTL